jgi:uncharacterized ferredoxin-like protein
MYSIGAAALRAGFLRNSDVALGIPLSAYGKSIYFDRNCGGSKEKGMRGK